MTTLILRLQIFAFLYIVHFNMLLSDLDVNATLYKIVGGFAGFVGGGSALSFLYAGYLWMFAGDNHQQELRARQIFGGSIVGAVVALAAVTFAKIITSSIVNQ